MVPPEGDARPITLPFEGAIPARGRIDDRLMGAYTGMLTRIAGDQIEMAALTGTDAELHRVITASVHELLETAQLEVQAGPVDEDQIERLIFRAAAPIVHSVSALTAAQRGELLPNIVRVMLPAFLEAQAR